MRVLITGVTGFAGTHLRRALSASRYDVFGTSFPLRPPSSEKNLFCMDLRSGNRVLDLVREVRPDWIFHLAAVSNVRQSWMKRRETMESNLLGTFNLFEAARQKTPRARILFISSSDIFGTVVSRRRKLTEESPFRIVSPYAFTKVAGELLSAFYAAIEGLDVVIARPFPHTGPGQTADFVCSDWAGQIARIERGEAEPVIKVGNLDVRRDFSDVRDTVRAYVALMKKGRRGEVYNICSGKGVTLGRILSTLIEHARLKRKPDGGKTAISVEVDPAKLRKVDVTLLVGRNRKIRQETGWSPSVPLEKTLADLLADWRARLKAGA